MKILSVGGGPAGLYFAILMKSADANHDVTVVERNPAGESSGWGVVYWEDLLDKLRDNDPETAQAIRDSSYRWADQIVHINAEKAIHPGGHGYAISRRRLTRILADRATDLGVRVRFSHEISDPADLSGTDLVVAADGAGSRLRERRADRFRTSLTTGRNRYIWLGTTAPFTAFTFAFVETDHGWIWFHAYGFDGETSTCIVECGPETWTGLGFDRLSRSEGLALMERIFERYLDGHSLMDARHGSEDHASWRTFSALTNDRWHDGNVVLMGDAAHTTHFSIGSGTRLALEDAIELSTRLHTEKDIPSALEAYTRARQAALMLPQSEALYSARWYENVSRYVGLEPTEFTTLMLERRSPLLPHVPPHRYYQLHRASQKIGVLRRIRSWVGPGARELYSRRTSQTSGADTAKAMR